MESKKQDETAKHLLWLTDNQQFITSQSAISIINGNIDNLVFSTEKFNFLVKLIDDANVAVY
ncbi:hypothetical protein Riv7116_6456 [Rivularia sp. PCC 7116]|nr:hypothetical protein Riv7116_6456 [Rivularia sp. PCC 7116]